MALAARSVHMPRLLVISIVALCAFALPSCGAGRPVTGDASPWHAVPLKTPLESDGITMAFDSDLHGWLVRFGGRGVQETRDGGRSWHASRGRIVNALQARPYELPTRVARVPNVRDLMRVGDALFITYGRSRSRGSGAPRVLAGVLVSRDGGRDFRRCLTLPSRGWTVSRFVASDARHVWALCEGPAPAPVAAIPAGLVGCAVVTAPRGQVADQAAQTDHQADHADHQALLASGDGGATWRTVWRGRQNDSDSGLLVALQFVDALHGWGTTGTNLLTTSDGGLTWRRVDPPYEGFTVAIGASHLWYAWGVSGDEPSETDGDLTWSSDGGHTWHEVGRFHHEDMSGAIYFADATHGWVEGPGAGDDYLAIWATSDGGHDWQRELDFRPLIGGSYSFARAGNTLIYSNGEQTFTRRLPAMR